MSGNTDALSDAAKRGLGLFLSERLECFHCHGGFNFSDSLSHQATPFDEVAFHNTGLYNIDGQGSYPHPNQGIFSLTGDPLDMGRFKAPSLRNIALTAPYMHDGSIQTLREVVEHYAAGGRTITEGEYAGIGSDNPYKSEFVPGFIISEEEMADLLTFLETLTDDSFITNPAFSDPFQTQ
jgi:cytochrome c peroxidase